MQVLEGERVLTLVSLGGEEGLVAGNNNTRRDESRVRSPHQIHRLLTAVAEAFRTDDSAQVPGEQLPSVQEAPRFGE